MSEKQVKTITVHELKQRLENNPELHLIDVREPHEWQALHIPGATLIPRDQVIEKIEELVEKQDDPIYLHCHSGMRSLMAAQYLLHQGYHEVYSIEGGIMDWASCGYPVQSQE